MLKLIRIEESPEIKKVFNIEGQEKELVAVKDTVIILIKSLMQHDEKEYVVFEIREGKAIMLEGLKLHLAIIKNKKDIEELKNRLKEERKEIKRFFIRNTYEETLNKFYKKWYQKELLYNDFQIEQLLKESIQSCSITKEELRKINYKNKTLLEILKSIQ
ncbi:hypothetical protein FDJ70_07800 [Clostridium botulinum]|uniref:hypothetical protein n=1 Tax=Clostridium botulinum TaxID=1491 RepID=UPI0013FB42AD|nr:hypothetical protein [Clostridium botulinum]MCD3217434.1 hypothetical protein [Clostridium botulinum C]NFV47576.1 hypothetical protein [Clostridium botulinum]